MRIDDICKCLVLDPYLDFQTRKTHKTIMLSPEIKTEIKAIMHQYSSVNQKNLKEIQSHLIDIIKYHKLYMEFHIELSWLEVMLSTYLKVISEESLVDICECNRYTGDGSKGLSVKAKRNIPKNTKLNLYHPLSEKTSLFLQSQNWDYSFVKSDRYEYDVLMLGPVACVNHNCHANCEYDTISEHVLRIKAVQDIVAGEELYCYYRPDYFGDNNEHCQCQTRTSTTRIF